MTRLGSVTAVWIDFKSPQPCYLIEQPRLTTATTWDYFYFYYCDPNTSPYNLHYIIIININKFSSARLLWKSSPASGQTTAPPHILRMCICVYVCCSNVFRKCKCFLHHPPRRIIVTMLKGERSEIPKWPKNSNGDTAARPPPITAQSNDGVLITSVSCPHHPPTDDVLFRLFRTTTDSTTTTTADECI